MKNNTILAIVVAVLVGGFAYWWLTGERVAPAPVEDGVGLTEATASLTEHTWVWEQTVMNDGAVIEPAQEGAFTLTFSEEGMISGSTDCNSFSGDYTLDEMTLSTGPLAMTLMYCEGSQEMEFIEMVTTAQFVFFTEEDDLVLLLPYDSGSVLFSKGS